MAISIDIMALEEQQIHDMAFLIFDMNSSPPGAAYMLQCIMSALVKKWQKPRIGLDDE